MMIHCVTILFYLVTKIDDVAMKVEASATKAYRDLMNRWNLVTKGRAMVLASRNVGERAVLAAAN
jgi:hypothetical protein